MNDIIPILLTIIVVGGVFAVGYIILLNNIQAYSIKTHEAEVVIDHLSNQKYDLLMLLVKIIKKETDVNKKIFDIKNREEQNISLINFERKLTELNELVLKIYDDHKIIKVNEEFNNALMEIADIEEKLEAAKTFYNKYTNYLNTQIKKFPSNLIAKIHHVDSCLYFDCKKALN